MSKILSATCDIQGNVTADETLIADPIVISEGTKASAGVLVIDESNVWYLTSNASDVKDLITRLVQIVTQLETILTGVDAASNSPGGQTSAIAQLTTYKNQLDESKDNLK